MALRPIYLEPDEEITSVIEKIKAADSRQVAIVVPKNSTIFQSLVNLKLLLREAKNADKTVALISANKVGSRLAKQVGIETYATLGNVADSPALPDVPTVSKPSPVPETIDGITVHRYEGAAAGDEVLPDESELAVEPEVTEPDAGAKEEELESPIGNQEEAPTESIEKQEPNQPEKPSAPIELPAIVSRGIKRNPLSVPKISIPWKSVVAAAVIVLIGLVIMVLFLPKGDVTLSFVAKPVSKTVTLQAKTVNDNEDATVMGNLLETEKTNTQTITSTGKKDIGTKATGNLTFSNKASSTAVTLGAGTTVTASSKTFTTDKAVTIPGASVAGGNVVPGQATGSVTATTAGDTYNLSSVQFSVSGQSALVYANGSTSGGTTKTVTILSQDDVDKAYAALKTSLTADATTDVQTKANGQTLLDAALKVDVTSQSVDKGVGSQVDSATATVKVKASAIVFDSAVATEKLKTALGKDLLDNEQLVIPDSHKPTMVYRGFNDEKTVMTFEISGSGFAAPKIDKSEVAKSVTNKSIAQAENLLKDKYKAESTVVKVTPSWWLKRLPFFSKAIIINYGFIEPKTDAVPGP